MVCGGLVNVDREKDYRVCYESGPMHPLRERFIMVTLIIFTINIAIVWSFLDIFDSWTDFLIIDSALVVNSSGCLHLELSFGHFPSFFAAALFEALR